MKRLNLLITIFFIVPSWMSTAQTDDVVWHRVDSLEKRQYYSQAYSEALEIYNNALTERNSRQSLTGVRYLASIGAHFMEGSNDSALCRYKSLLPSLLSVDQAICRIFLADFYASFFSNNSWSIMNNAVSDENNLDYSLWHYGRLFDTVSTLVRDALSDPILLQQVSAESLGKLVTVENGDDGDLTPTLYDVMVRKAIEILAEMRYYTKLQLSDIDSPELLFAEPERFVDLRISSSDLSKSVAQFAIQTLQQYEKFHLIRGDSDGIMMKMYNQRISNISSFLNFTSITENDFLIEQLPKVITHYRKGNNEHITQLYFSLATLLNDNKLYVEAIKNIDTAIALYPDSPGAVDCFNLRKRIMCKKITVDMEHVAISSSYQLGIATTRNVDHLYFRVIKYVNTDRISSDDKKRQFLLAQTVVEQWDQPIALSGKYDFQRTFFVVPQMPQGDYLLLISCESDFETEGIVEMHFMVEDLAFLADRYSGSNQRGFVVNRTTGKPVPNQEVTLRGKKNYNSTYRDLVTIKTDKDGYYDFSSYIKSNWKTTKRYVEVDVVTTYNGYVIKNNKYGILDNDTIAESHFQLYNHYFLDRPIYKPGDTVHFAFLTYRQNRLDAYTVSSGNDDISFVLRDINNKAIDTLLLKADSYGLCDGEFILSVDAMPGQWGIRTDDRNREITYFTVEAYKQPKFTVTLSKPAVTRHFGEMARFEGMAASYTAVPVGDAKITYSITRSEIVPRWCWGWSRWWHQVSPETVVANGELTTNADGTFTVEFVPLPDSNINISYKPCFTYSITVKVTDLNGETHEATESMNVGYVGGYAVIKNEDSGVDDSFTIVCSNFDGASIDGIGRVVVERLATPTEPKLLNRLISVNDSTISMPFSRKEFEKMFPLFDYDGSTADYEHWPVEKRIYTNTVHTTTENPYRYSLKGQKEGVYHITAVIVTDDGDTLSAETYKVYEPSNAKRPIKSDLIVASVEKRECEIGDSVKLRVGSRFDDVTFIVLVNKENVSYRHEIHHVSNEYINIYIPVAKELIGGFKVEVAAIKANQFANYYFTIDVPYSEKKLNVTFETFRNKLEPGNSERWTLRISDSKSGLPYTARLLMTMYDHALDNYGNLAWNLTPWRQWYTRETFNIINFVSSNSITMQPVFNYRYAKDYKYHIVSFKKVLYEYRYVYHRSDKLILMKSGGTVHGEGNLAMEEEMEYEMDSETETRTVSTPGFFESNTLESVDKESSEELHIRTNLNTLAFFRPLLTSDNNGNVEIKFTVPELLTEWSINGLAWTEDMKVGSIKSQAITQKRLMAVPNVPRFLRQGDTCLISVKVSNLSGREQDIAVTLRMTDAVNDNVLPILVGDTVKHIHINDNASGQVAFLVAVPQGNLFVAKYLIVANGDGVSDGEQATIAILPNRQLVTESMAFYINGIGEKHCELKHLVDLDTLQSDFSLVNHSLTVDITPNPIWLAIQSLPYVARQKNPSNIYLANAIYSNSLSFKIVDDNPKIKDLFHRWGKKEPDAFQSELDRNSNLKQTVMEETPWLQDAISEEQRHRDVACFFNNTTIKNQLQNDLNCLLSAQLSDGGWSWIDGGQYSSLYTTQYILKTFGHLRQLGVEFDSRTRHAMDRALDYVDRETYTYYTKFVKNHGYDVINLDYLYLRSLYPDNTLSKQQKEAYDYFYNNAKKNNESYRTLFNQAMLSVVFNRAGDMKLAREIAIRIREKALYSDEMGMYWRDNISGWCWNERPIETQAMLIRTMAEVLEDYESVAKMQQWLLKQKQTTNWSTDVSTVNAIQSLLIDSSAHYSGFQIKNTSMTVLFGNHKLSIDTSRSQLHISQSITSEKITPDDGKMIVRKEDKGTAWGSMYWQYFERLEKIPSSSMGIALKMSIYKVMSEGKLTLVDPAVPLKVGDKVRIRIEINCDRNLEYLEIKEPRCAAFEPVSTKSGWNWNGGLSYYCSVTNTAHTLYIDRLEKGTYYVEHDFYVNNAGVYSTAPTTVQCLYAPEFRSVCPVPLLKVE